MAFARLVAEQERVRAPALRTLNSASNESPFRLGSLRSRADAASRCGASPRRQAFYLMRGGNGAELREPGCGAAAAGSVSAGTAEATALAGPLPAALTRRMRAARRSRRRTARRRRKTRT
jgi:hypothetical protein